MTANSRSAQPPDVISSIYRIRVVGFLDAGWSAHLGGMSVHHQADADGNSLTILTGELADQAALYGVLNGLYGLGFSLLSVECLSI